MNKKISIMVILTLLLPMMASTVTAADTITPASYSVSITVTSGSTFTVELPPGVTGLTFNGMQGDTNINANGQSDIVPWAIITNTGIDARTYTIGLDSNPPSGITLTARDDNGVLGGITVDGTIKNIPGAALAIGAQSNVWIKASYSPTATLGAHPNNVAIRNYLPTLNSITVSGPISLASAATATYTATGYDQIGNTIPVTVVWTATAGSFSGNSYTAPTVAADTEQTVTITATAGAISDDITVVVTGPSSI